MGLVTGTGLQNQSDLIDAVRSALVNEGLTQVINDGTVPSNDKEVWLHLPAANTKNGIDILFGMLSVPTSPPEDPGGRMRITISYLTSSEALLTGVSPRNDFFRVLGTPNTDYQLNPVRPTGNTGDVYPNGETVTNNINGDPCTVDGLNQGSNYLRHWIFTPSGSPLGSTEFYCYVVVEVTTGVYRTFGFGEGIKLGGSGWSGGLFVDATNNAPSVVLQRRRFLACDGGYNAFTNDGEHGYVLNFENEHYNVESPRTWNPWHFMGAPWSSNWMGCAGMGPHAFGLDYIQNTPAAFSGQSVRLPARIYAMNNIISGTEAEIGSPSRRDNNFRPLIECPDVFHTNIRDMTPGDTIEDDVEKFLVVPYISKTGSKNTGDYGFLIRNPDL